MEQKFWIRGVNGVGGPYDSTQIRGLVARKQFTADMDISKDGVAWQNAGRIKGLFPPPESVQINDFAAEAPAISPPLPPSGYAAPSHSAKASL
jgi:hypothetical protein